jgi:hypothetical protein
VEDVSVLGEVAEGGGGSLGHSLGSVGVGTGGWVRGGSGSDEVTAGLGDGVVGVAAVVGVTATEDEAGRTGIGVAAEDGRPGRGGRAE